MPVSPSGVIVVTPKSTANKPYAFPRPSQTFLVSEQGYSGSFTFSGYSKLAVRQTPFKAPAGVNLTLNWYCHPLFNGWICESWQVVVHDSLGNTAEIFAQSEI